MRRSVVNIPIGKDERDSSCIPGGAEESGGWMYPISAAGNRLLAGLMAYQLATAHAILESNPQQTKPGLADLNNDTSVPVV